MSAVSLNKGPFIAGKVFAILGASAKIVDISTILITDLQGQQSQMDWEERLCPMCSGKAKGHAKVLNEKGFYWMTEGGLSFKL